MPDHHIQHAADVREIVAAYLPEHPVDSVTRIGAGLDNVVYEASGGLIVRFSQEPDSARLESEAEVLSAVAGISPVPVPEPVFTVTELGCLAYFKLPGRPLLDLPRTARSAHGTSIGATLGELLAALHAAPTERFGGLVETDDHPLTEWRREAEVNFDAVVAHVPAGYHQAVEAFLAAEPPDPAYTPVFSHNDLGIEHVLVDPVTWSVTGVIDWSDAAIVDPAYDFGLIHRDLGPAPVRAALESYRTATDDPTALRERITFYARCSVLEDLAYGIETGQGTYTEKSIAALEWLFPV
ncbi:phosphotransferase family protein [Micromonospora sp. NPDC003197]